MKSLGRSFLPCSNEIVRMTYLIHGHQCTIAWYSFRLYAAVSRHVKKVFKEFFLAVLRQWLEPTSFSRNIAEAKSSLLSDTYLKDDVPVRPTPIQYVNVWGVTECFVLSRLSSKYVSSRRTLLEDGGRG